MCYNQLEKAGLVGTEARKSICLREHCLKLGYNKKYHCLIRTEAKNQEMG